MTAERKAYLAGYDAGAKKQPRECPYIQCATFAALIEQWHKGHDKGLTDQLRVEHHADYHRRIRAGTATGR